MQVIKKCTSCKSDVVGSAIFVKFQCPKCSKGEIIRCNKCRLNTITYSCSECGFEGPN